MYERIRNLREDKDLTQKQIGLTNEIKPYPRIKK